MSKRQERISSSSPPFDRLGSWHDIRVRGVSATGFFSLAFTDFSPNSGYGQLVLMGQRASGNRYLTAAIPLLASLIATFASP